MESTGTQAPQLLEAVLPGRYYDQPSRLCPDTTSSARSSRSATALRATSSGHGWPP